MINFCFRNKTQNQNLNYLFVHWKLAHINIVFVKKKIMLANMNIVFAKKKIMSANMNIVFAEKKNKTPILN